MRIPTATLNSWKSWSKVGWCNKFLPHLSPFNLGQYHPSLFVNAKVIKKSGLLLSIARNAVLPIQNEAISKFCGTPVSFGNTQTILMSARTFYSYSLFFNAVFVAVFLKLFIPFFFCLIIRLDSLETALRKYWHNFHTTSKKLWNNLQTAPRKLWDNFEPILRQLWENFETIVEGLWNQLEATLENIATTLGPPDDCLMIIGGAYLCLVVSMYGHF